MQATFLYLTGRIAPDIIALIDGTKLRLIQDERGSVVRVVNADTGVVMQSISYDPWGRVLSDTNPGYQPFGYAGGLTDQLTGLVHFGAREYHPTTGTFLTRDPIEDQTGDPYTYAANNPVNATDPTGQACLGNTCLGFHPETILPSVVNIGRGASYGLSDDIANFLSPGASCTVPENVVQQFVGVAATTVATTGILGKATRVGGGGSMTPTIGGANTFHNIKFLGDKIKDSKDTCRCSE